jgi:hypothetical protein
MKMKLLLFMGLIAGSVSLSFITASSTYAQQATVNYFAPTVILAVDDATPATDPAAEDTGPPSTCKIEGIGWILCPVVKEMAKVVDGAYAFVSSLLAVQPLLSTGKTAGVYNAWSIMRNFANVAFVIAFLIIIFSQLTSVGLNNYGIKKMLPRLIVAAILVNISFWICAVAVDVSNILGSSVNGLFHNIVTNPDNATCKVMPTEGTQNCMKFTVGEDDAASTGEGWAGIAGLVLAGTGVAIGVLYATFAALLPALLAAILAIVTVFLVLTLRQALIILLIVVSPLAFVAYLLPNTESLFKKWLGLFKTLLLMYPIIAGIFGASALASVIVMQTAQGDYKVAIQIMGAAISIIPLALTPVVMKTAGGLLNRFGGIVNNPNKGPVDKLRKKAEGYRDYRQGLAKGRRIKRASDFRAGKTFNGKVGSKLFGAAGSDDRKLASRAFGGAYEANQRDRKRKDVLGAFDSAAEQTYNESAEGQKYATAAIQAKNRAGTASTNIAALAAETTAKSDLNAAQSAKDRQTIAQNNNETYSESNRDLGTRLEQALSKASLDKAQKIGEATIEEMKAADSRVPTPLAATVQELRDASLETKVATGQIDAAQRVQANTYNEKVMADAALAARIGGVDQYGAQRAVSTSTTAAFKVFDDAVSDERKTMTKIIPSKDEAIRNGLPPEQSLEHIMENTSESVERRAAAASMIIKGGADKDIIKTFDYLGQQALQLQNDPARAAEFENIKSVQQQVAADIGQRKPTSIGQGTISSMGRGQFAGTFDEQVVSRTSGGKINAEALARTSADELVRMDAVYTAKAASGTLTNDDKIAFGKLSDSINKFRNDPLNKGKQPPQEIADLMDKIESDFRQFVPIAQQAAPQPAAGGGAGNLFVPHAQQPQPSAPTVPQQPYTPPANTRSSMPPNTSGYTPSAGGIYNPYGSQQPPTPPQQPPTGPTPPSTP